MCIKHYSVVLLLLQIIYLVNGQGELCSMPNDQPGLCQILANCPSLLQLYQENQGSREVISYLVQSQKNCGTRSVNRNPIVCCRDNIQSQTTQPPPPLPNPEAQTQLLCSDPNGVPGSCIGIKSCPAILNEFVQRQNDPAYVRYVQGSNANCDHIQQNICCPTPTSGPQTDRAITPSPNQGGSTPRLLTPATGCGYTDATFNRVVGGEPARLGAWPWMTLVGYTDSLGEVSFKCGGSLITSKHVLTAAHCIKSTLSTVRLGEHDLSLDTETKHVDIPVVKVEKHPKYDKKDGHSDLAILYLESPVQFTKFIHPVCIPYQDPLKSKSFVKFNSFVAGWGRTQEGGKSATVLQQLQLPILANSKCMEKYKAVNKLISTKQFDDAVLCAGHLEGGKDSCQGDSGGPLVAPSTIDGKAYFFQIGIVSYGIGCARADIPGVYAKVQTFVDWIQQKIAEPV